MYLPAASGFGLNQIGQIAIPVKDIEQAVAFDRDTEGMRLLFQAPPSLDFLMSVACGKLTLLGEVPTDDWDSA